MATKKLKFEEAFDALKLSSTTIENKGASLDEAIKAFEEGLKHYETCIKILDQAELKVEEVTAKSKQMSK